MINKRGEIGTSLTFLALFLITLGIVLGSSVVTDPSRRATTTEASTPAGITEMDNGGHINVTYPGPPVRRSINPKMDVLTGELCLGKTPPQNGTYQVKVILKKNDSAATEMEIGAAIQEHITGNPSWYVCGAPNSRRKQFAAAYWNNLASIADKVAHADVPFNEIESISLRLNTSGGAWAMSSGTIFATLDKTLFASEGEIPTNTPTPTPGPAQPADVEVEVNITGELKEGFSKFDFIVKTCNLNAQGNINVSDCGGADNKQTETMTASAIPGTATRTLTGVGGGNRGLVLFYGYHKPDGKKDVTGIMVNPGSDTCNKKRTSPKGGDYGCEIIVNGTKITRKFNVALPDKNTRTFEFFYGKELDARNLLQNCSFMADTVGATRNNSQTPCVGQFADGRINLQFTNSGTRAEKIYWLLRRCNGKIDQNGNHCIPNQTTEGIDIDNTFFEATSPSIDVGERRTCIFSLNDFPAETADATDASVRAILEDKCITTQVTITPTPTTMPSIPLPPPNPTRYYTTFAIYNNSAKTISQVKVTTCYGSSPCTTESIDTAIAKSQRGQIDYELKVPTDINSYTIKCAIRYQGETQDVACPTEVNSAVRQNVIYKMVAGATALTGGGFTELQASDVNSDGCTNGSDFSEVVNQYALEIPPTSSNGGDINGDGIINSLDIIYTLENLNKGDSCAFNK